MEFPWSKYPSFGGAYALRLKRRWLILGGIVCLGAVGAAGFGLYLLTSGYLQERALRASRGYFESGDVRSGQLMLEQTVQLYPDNVNARRMLAEHYLGMGSARAVGAWRDVVQREPGVDANYLSLAEAALAFGDEATIKDAVGKISAAGRATVAYYRVLAGLALRRREPDSLKAELTELERLEPGGSRIQFNLAAVDLNSTDPAKAAEARTKLEQMAAGESDRIRATLQLLQLAGSRPRELSVPQLARRILAVAPGDPAGLTLAFADHMKAQPKPSADDAADLVRWLSSHGMAADALAWAGMLPSEIGSSRVVELARASAAIHAKDWTALESAVKGGAWGWIRPDLIESAFAANKQRASAAITAMNSWDLAVDQATGSLVGLRFLDSLGIALGWPEARDRVLWRMGRDYSKETGAWQILALQAEDKGDTLALARIYDAWLLAEPDDPLVKASRAVLSVIRGEGLGDARAYLSESVAQPQPLVEEVAAWAWLESQAGRHAAALVRLDAMQRQIRVSPRACLFYGLMLAEADRRAEARLYLTKAERQPKLLPEEKALLDRARGLAGRGI